MGIPLIISVRCSTMDCVYCASGHVRFDLIVISLYDKTQFLQDYAATHINALSHYTGLHKVQIHVWDEWHTYSGQ